MLHVRVRVKTPENYRRLDVSHDANAHLVVRTNGEIFLHDVGELAFGFIDLLKECFYSLEELPGKKEHYVINAI